MKILVIDGHPNNESLCSTLAEKYVQGANAGGHEVDLLKIRDLDFNPNLQYGYAKPMDLEQDLIKVQDLIRECDHIVLVLPYWWSGLPALFKGFVDRVFAGKISEYIVNLLKLLIDNGRQSVVNEIYKAFVDLNDIANNRQRITVITQSNLDVSLLDKIKADVGA